MQKEAGFAPELIDSMFLYVSDVCDAALDLTALVESAIRRNRADRITGLLGHDGHSFVQFVEGPTAPVHALFGRLESDPRHRNVEVLMFAATNGVRRFRDWDMAQVELQSASKRIASIRGLRSLPAVQAFEELFENVEQRYTPFRTDGAT